MTGPTSDLAAQLANAPEAPPNPYDKQTTDERPRDTSSAGDGGGHDADRRDATDRDEPPHRRGRPRGEIFEDCPVIPLGVYGDLSFYLDRLGQLRSVDNHSLDKIRHVFCGDVRLLALHFPQFDKEGSPRPGKFDQANVAAAMTAATSEKGVWKPTNRVRGAGSWTDEFGKLVIHAGDAVWIDGKWQHPGIYDGKVYVAADPVPRPAKTAPRGDPATDLLELLQTWEWQRPDIDPQLMLGFIMAQMLGGALNWRPVMWLTGDKASGKSEFQKLLFHVHGGEAGLLQAANATGAGIRSVVGNSCLPVAIDELEPDRDRGSRVKDVIELARLASSGGKIFRGSTDQTGHQSNAFSCFLFSSILVSAMPAQDRSRMIVLNLDQIPADKPSLKMDPRRLRKIGEALRRSILEGWETWADRLQLWFAALARHDQTKRGIDNYGTVLALADMALHPDLPSAETLDNWALKLGRGITEDAMEVGSNAEDMVLTLMGQYFDPYRRGEQYTIAQWIMAAARLHGAPHSLWHKNMSEGEGEDAAKRANETLAKVGLRVKGAGNEAQLFLPNKPIPALCVLFRDSQWADGGWAQASRRLPGAEFPPTPLRLAGIQSRGVYVPFASIAGLSDFQTDTPVAARGPRTRRGEEITPEDFA